MLLRASRVHALVRGMGKRAAVAEAEIDDDSYEEGPDPDDVLSRGWKVGLYGAALVPYIGSWFVVLGSSILFYVWRKEHPNKAKSVNRHGWLAWLMGLAVWGGIWFLSRESAGPAAYVCEFAPPIAAPQARRPSLEERRDSMMANINQKVASDAVARYRIAARQGDKIQICVQAGMVAAAYLQAQDEHEYTSWKGIQKADCAKAGMPQQ
jgi:hypothetical protein